MRHLVGKIHTCQCRIIDSIPYGRIQWSCSVSVYFRLSFVVTGIALMFIQWMADSPVAYNALKFINKLTGAA